MKINQKNITKYLDRTDFESLFIEELGWDYPQDDTEKYITVDEQIFTLTPIAEKRGFITYQCILENQKIPLSPILKKIDQEISKYSYEHLIIYASSQDKNQKWQWTKKEGNKVLKTRVIEYSSSKKRVLLDALEAISISLAEEDNLSLLNVKEKAKKAFDIEKVTKKFFTEFQLEHRKFVEFINGIDDIKDKNWYASVILNRLMFVYFLQKKGFLDKDNKDYLQDKLKQSKLKGENLFYREFLQSLFFEGFGKRAYQRSEVVTQLIGDIKYLNGGLFLPHIIEQKYKNKISIDDRAFSDILQLFASYTWHLDDTPTGNENEINPDVLGYIFEKYINQKAFGAYYTKPEITNYLCEKTINKYLSNWVKQASSLWGKQDSNLSENTNQQDACFTDEICNLLLDDILPNLSILDPACGSGAFLVAGLHHLIKVYTAIFDWIKTSGNEKNKARLTKIKNSHPSLEYYIKKRIITDNLYGVDIMEEATEIAKLRLFLSLVASAETVADLEPLPNVDFNIMAGNSLIGLIRVDGNAFDTVKVPFVKGDLGGSKTKSDPPQPPLVRGEKTVQGNLLNLIASSEYQKILAEKNESIKKYKEHAFKTEEIEGTDQDSRLQMLRNHIEKVNQESNEKLNQLLLDEFTLKLGIKYEQVQLKGKPQKRLLTMKDVENLKPFHWGYHFDKIIAKGGFDIILGNPPWEIFKPQAKEFFAEYSDLVTKNKMDIKTFEKQQKKLLENPEIAEAWLAYQSQYPHVSLYFRSAEQYKNQISVVNGKKQGTDINLYKLFLEQCVNLLAKNGECGIVIPSGIYTDLGTKQLREMLFSQTTITGLFCFENKKAIFEGVHKNFKFVILTFENFVGANGRSPLPLMGTTSFPARFMRHEVSELNSFPDESAIIMDVDLIKKLSPDSLSIMEFKSDLDIEIAKKMARFPLLGEEIKDKWNLKLTREFDMTNDSYLFKTEAGKGRLPLYEGKMIHQFIHNFAQPRYWIEEKEGRKAVLGKNGVDEGQILDYQCYRLAYRSIARSTDSRTFISSIIPKNVYCGHSLNVSLSYENNKYLLILCCLLNSFCFDFSLRQQVSANLTMFFVYQTPIPRLTEGDLYFQDIVEKAGKLICTSAEYDDLAQEIGLVDPPQPPLTKGGVNTENNSLTKGGVNTENNSLTKGGVNTENNSLTLSKGGLRGDRNYGVTDKEERENLRAEIDAIVGHLYGLNEVEFKHILSTFPIVKDDIKEKTLKAFLAYSTEENRDYRVTDRTVKDTVLLFS
ncbi:Eco57I restriction-modification methylase domain-containing protein [Geminocystis herdmanii]|uniref:Eco57I restriction-modification methylase domain-containing protein n=1 Tax=Geminocystis herdmanii TaxID=669359 RepID=UPI00034A7396|nr:DNA methyltransferase [Geminocystis herdmanii]